MKVGEECIEFHRTPSASTSSFTWSRNVIGGNVNTFGGIIKRPLEFDVGRIGVNNAFYLGLLLFGNAVDSLLVWGTGGSVCYRVERIRKARMEKESSFVSILFCVLVAPSGEDFQRNWKVRVYFMCILKYFGFICWFVDSLSQRFGLSLWLIAF